MQSIVRDERQARAMTQDRLATAAGIAPRTLRKMEKGGVVSAETVASVCAVLGLDPRRVLTPPEPDLVRGRSVDPERLAQDRRRRRDHLVFLGGVLGLVVALCGAVVYTLAADLPQRITVTVAHPGPMPADAYDGVRLVLENEFAASDVRVVGATTGDGSGVAFQVQARVVAPDPSTLLDRLAADGAIVSVDVP